MSNIVCQQYQNMIIRDIVFDKWKAAKIVIKISKNDIDDYHKKYYANNVGMDITFAQVCTFIEISVFECVVT